MQLKEPVSGTSEHAPIPHRVPYVTVSQVEWSRTSSWHVGRDTSVEQPLILDRYRPLEVLGSGGYGEVVAAFDTRMHRRVAIKRLPLEPAAGEGISVPAAGLAEARTAALLTHPNIVTVHEWDTDSDEAFIIMEYVDGMSLAEILDAEGALDLDEAASVIEAVCSALEFAHANGVLHLDIKPENVLVTRDGRTKVTDFGIAALSALAGHGHAAGGTLGFMPLEQLRGDAVDERSDVWAFGALCFELLADANPFAAETVEAAIFKAEIVTPPAPSDLEPSLPRAIDGIILSALATSPSERYTTVGAFGHRLLGHLGDAAAGRESLAAVVDEHTAEDTDAQALRQAGVGLWDRLGRWSFRLARLAASAGAAWLAWAGVSPFVRGNLAAAAAGALAGLAAVLAPALGIGLALFVLTAGTVAAGWWWFALPFALVSAAAWWFAGREDAGLLSSVAAPPLGALGIAPLTALLAGFVLRPRFAAITSAYGAVLLMLSSAASGAGPPYLAVEWGWLAQPLGTGVVAGALRELVATPAPVAVVAGWAGGAAIMSVACKRASRPAAVLGMSLGTLVMYAGYVGAELTARLFDASVTWMGQVLLRHLTASLILMVLVIAAGPPVRPEEE